MDLDYYMVGEYLLLFLNLWKISGPISGPIILLRHPQSPSGPIDPKRHSTWGHLLENRPLGTAAFNGDAKSSKSPGTRDPTGRDSTGQHWGWKSSK